MLGVSQCGLGGRVWGRGQGVCVRGVKVWVRGTGVV